MVIHEDADEERADGDGDPYDTVLVAGDPPSSGGYMDAVRMAAEQYGSREPSPMARSAAGGGGAGSSPQSGYWAAVASASEAGVLPCTPMPAIRSSCHLNSGRATYLLSSADRSIPSTWGFAVLQ